MAVLGLLMNNQPDEFTSSEDLMARVAKGDKRAFEVLVKCHQRAVLNIIYRFIGDRQKAEDLAQEGREAVIRRHRQAPDCPESHLVVQARSAIYHYLRRGSSVDGKLDDRSRLRHYQVFSLEEPIVDNGRLQGEVISDPEAPRRPTEERACINILFDCLRGSLSEAENQALDLRLMDVPWQEVGQGKRPADL